MKLEQEVIQWAEDRGIFQKATAKKQALKTLEECTELLQAIEDLDHEEIKDAIGDIVVTLIIQCEMQGVTLEGCLHQAYNVIKDRKGSMKNGTFVKEVSNG